MSPHASIPPAWGDFHSEQPGAILPEAIQRYEADLRLLQRVFDAPGSRARRQRLRAVLDAWSRALEALEWEKLAASDRVDALLMENHIEWTRWSEREEERRLQEMADACAAVPRLIEVLDARRLLEDLGPRACADALVEATTALDGLREGLESREVSPVLGARFSRFLRDLKGALESWHAFYHGYDPLYSWWVSQPYDGLVRSLEACAQAAERCAGGAEGAEIAGDPAGREALVKQLELEMIPYSPEELMAMGEREAGWCREEMLQAAADMGYGGDWRAALEAVKKDHVAEGEQARLVRDLAYEAIRFVEEHDLLTVPALAREGWRMEMMTPERQKVNPFFLGGESIVVSYPTADMPHGDKLMSMRGNNRHFSRATVHHELIPGHFLQAFWQERSRPYRRVFHTPFWTEGWALYWEMRLWEQGFPRTPEERMGMLFWRMHRAARVVFSLKFHMGEMTARDCVEMLVHEVGHEQSTAEGEVRRSFGGDYPPLYQCAYLIGGLQMRALHRELVENGSLTERAFHDAVLSENCMPVALLRATLTGEKMPKGWRPVWRFA